MLEWAAMAAGANDVRIGGDSVFVQWKSNARGYVHWNPLTDDGDALRLAVRLQLNVCNEHLNAGVAYCTRSLPGAGLDEDRYPEVRSGTNENEVIDADYAATRRAIVLAAAEIGKRGS
jgi:hypothetical protein